MIKCQTSLSLLDCKFCSKLNVSDCILAPFDFFVSWDGGCWCRCNDTDDIEPGDECCDVDDADGPAPPVIGDICCWLLPLPVPVLLLLIVECGALDVVVKLLCDWILRDFNNGGFFIDDENANPRRNVALYR